MPTEYWDGTGHPVTPIPPTPCVDEKIVVAAQSDLRSDEAAIALARYAYLVEYDECAFFGVQPPGVETSACRRIWTKPERDMTLKYLLEAQDEVEQIVNYPLKARWIENEQRPYSFPIHAENLHIIEAGIRAESDIALSTPVNHATDPAVIGPVATTVTDLDEIHVYHPGTDLEIYPSRICLGTGTVTIEIPRCRMVTEAACDNDKGGLVYTDLSNFEGDVDVKRVYNDISTQGTLVWPHRCVSTNYCGCTCGDYRQTACIYVRTPELGTLDVLPGTYSAGSWSTACARCCGEPDHVLLNYRAGLTELTYQAEDAIIRLAHAKMPYAPCGCEIYRRVWQRDTHVPDVLSRERYNCPFGMSDGAWMAWRFANSGGLKIQRSYTL